MVSIAPPCLFCDYGHLEHALARAMAGTRVQFDAALSGDGGADGCNGDYDNRFVVRVKLPGHTCRIGPCVQVLSRYIRKGDGSRGPLFEVTLNAIWRDTAVTHEVSSLAFAQIMTPDPLTLLRLIRRRIAMYEASQSLTGTVKYILSAAQIERLLDEFGGPGMLGYRANADPISETRDGSVAAVLVPAPCIAGEDDKARGACRDSMVWCIESGDLPQDGVNGALVAIAQRTAVVWMHTHPPPCAIHVYYANYRRDNPRGLVLARWDHLCRATSYVCDWIDGESTWSRGLFE